MHHFIILFTATRKVTYLNSVILCHVLNGEQWTRTKTKSKQIKPNRSWSFFFRIVFFLFLWASCLLLLLVEWVCTTLFFWSDAPSHHVWSCIERKLNLVCSHRSLAWIRYWYYWKLLLIVLLWFPMDFISFASLCFVCTVFAFVDDSECVFDELKQSSRSPGTQSTAYKMYQKARGNV